MHGYIFQKSHVISCNEFTFLKNLLELTPYEEDFKCSLTDLIFTKIIDKWSLILFQESIAINRMKPSLNHESKASKDLLIFKYQMKYERQICRQYFIVLVK